MKTPLMGMWRARCDRITGKKKQSHAVPTFYRRFTSINKSRKPNVFRVLFLNPQEELQCKAPQALHCDFSLQGYSSVLNLAENSLLAIFTTVCQPPG